MGKWPDWMIAYAIILAMLIVINTVNVLNILHDRARLEQPVSWWKAAVWEGSSGLALAAFAWIPMMMAFRFSFEKRRWFMSLAAHLAATVIFSLLHVGSMILLRQAAYSMAGDDYAFGGGNGELLYEYRKDILTYTIFAATFWVVRHMRPGQDQAPPSGPELFEIDEGPRLIRVPPSDILCARSAGNYVEFFLADGRRPLMRTTLSGVEELLATCGFVRTHKSWLANASHVAEATAEGSGDYGLRLTDGTEVPLSRRYPAALASLRRLKRAN